jgi:hypothetical protein
VDTQSVTGKVGSWVENVVYITEAEGLPSPLCELTSARLPSNKIYDLAAILGAKGQCTLTFMVEIECRAREANRSAADGPQSFVTDALIEKPHKLVIVGETPGPMDCF